MKSPLSLYSNNITPDYVQLIKTFISNILLTNFLKHFIMEQVAERIRKESTKDALAVSRVYSSTYQKEGTETAELKQAVKTISFYPTKSVSNNMQDNIFGQSDFGFEEQQFENIETRVAWIDVPVGTTPVQVQAKLANYPGATLYRCLANHPILTDNQVYAIKAGLTTKDVLADSQIVRYPENDETIANGTAGKIALDRNGKPQYRQIFFAASTKDDMDKRSADPADFYASTAIMAELSDVDSSHVVEGQSLPK
jgi:hypothetical protein